MTHDTIRHIDPDGMYDAIGQFPQHLSDGRQRAPAADLSALPDGDAIAQVVVVGMGGSAIGGDLLRTYALDEARIPIYVSRSYELPRFVSTDTLVVASSYSGNTEETLSGLAQAQAAGAHIACLTSGGELKRMARAHKYPCIEMPGGFQPRAALGYSFGALLALAEHCGLVTIGDGWEEAVELARELCEQYADPSGNEARELAEAIYGNIPLVYSSEGFLEAVNLRWRGQVEENSKTLAFGNLLPEQNHNEIMGWERRHPVHDLLSVVILRDSQDHSRVQRRVAVLRSLLEDRAASWHEVHSQGEAKLARMVSLLHLGDWMSYYLALLNEVNPTPVKLISEFKETLA